MVHSLTGMGNPGSMGKSIVVLGVSVAGTKTNLVYLHTSYLRIRGKVLIVSWYLLK